MQWYDVVFPNRTGKSASELTDAIKKHLIFETYFEQKFAPIAIDFDNDFDQDLDHSLLEFHSFTEVLDGPQIEMDLDDFVEQIKSFRPY